MADVELGTFGSGKAEKTGAVQTANMVEGWTVGMSLKLKVFKQIDHHAPHNLFLAVACWKNEIWPWSKNAKDVRTTVGAWAKSLWQLRQLLRSLQPMPRIFQKAQDFVKAPKSLWQLRQLL